MGKAKSIKQKRELAAELGRIGSWIPQACLTRFADDVKEFAAKRGARSEDASRSASEDATPEAKGEVRCPPVDVADASPPLMRSCAS